MRGRKRLGLLILGTLVTAAVAGQAPAVGSEFPANSYATGTQPGARVGVDGSGNFVLVWSSDNSRRPMAAFLVETFGLQLYGP
jgi:hypothetical protein